jgi:hypothetical protein
MKLFFKVPILFIVAFSGQLSMNVSAQERLWIKPDNKHIRYEGALFITNNDSLAYLQRFSEAVLFHEQSQWNPLKARTQTGIRIKFNTNSRKIRAVFQENMNAASRNNTFGLFKNGQFHSKHNSLDFDIDNSENIQAEWEIVLPPFNDVNFRGLEVDANARFMMPEEDRRPVYIAIGNSITHGAGQGGAGYLTYPFIIGQQNNWQVYNLGVGGSKISWPVAEDLQEIKADVISVLWGYNDWNAGYSVSESIEPNYKQLLKKLRENQPDALIFCILPTQTKRKSPKKGNHTLEEIRSAERSVVEITQSMGDEAIFIVDGEKITTIEDLNDVVHLSVKGAEKFANQLGEIMHQALQQVN